MEVSANTVYCTMRYVRLVLGLIISHPCNLFFAAVHYAESNQVVEAGVHCMVLVMDVLSRQLSFASFLILVGSSGQLMRIEAEDQHEITFHTVRESHFTMASYLSCPRQ